MKHFTITTEEQAQALRPYTMGWQSVGNIVSPSAGKAVTTHWPEYPEAYAITFEQCMSIVKDEVTDELLDEMGREHYWYNGIKDVNGHQWHGFEICDSDFDTVDFVRCIQTEQCYLQIGDDKAEIPNPTATKLRLLTKILRGE